MEPKGKPTINKGLNAITMIMCFPVLFSLFGIYGYHSSASATRMEGLYIVGFMGFFSMPVFILYLAALLIKRAEVSIKHVVISMLPFALLALMYWYALLEGAPF
jgi:hypothetical protein